MFAADIEQPFCADETRKVVVGVGERRVPEKTHGRVSHVRGHRRHGGVAPHVRHCQEHILDEQDYSH